MAESSTTTYRCDRCGAEIKRSYGEGLPNQWIRVLVERPQSTQDIDSYDICRGCADNFRGWVYDTSAHDPEATVSGGTPR